MVNIAHLLNFAGCHNIPPGDSYVFAEAETAMDYNWYPAYRDAVLETDDAKMGARLLLAEKQLIDRLRVLWADHGGTPEERQAIADALNGIKTLRARIVGTKRPDSESDSENET